MAVRSGWCWEKCARSVAMLGIVSALSAGCGGTSAPVDTDGGGSDSGQDAGASCACDDHQFCNGVETCNADGSCRPGTSPCTGAQTCDESADRCATTCSTDEDADGSIATACGGDDCDDANPARNPMADEVCDPAGLDEDCDPTTFGMTDADADGYVSAACCNGSTCGTDCNDASPTSHPTAPEVCDSVDQDCDGTTDESVQVSVYVDADGDGYGTGATVQQCADAPGYAIVSGDCDDAEPLANPSVPEVCDSIDNDCDGSVDNGAEAVSWYVDGDGDGYGALTTEPVLSCTPVAGHVPRAGDCNDADRTVSPGAVERCNGRDDNCNGSADYRIAPGNLEDDDGDGAADAACGAPLGTDCNDTDANIGPTVPELCGDTTDNDCDGTVDEAAGMSTWYLDADADGYGDSASVPITACSPQAGRSFRGGDCNDADVTIHPMQSDGCDGINADCDAQTDEDGVRYAFYTDTDMDGYGTGSPTFACVGPAGTADRAGDCADADVSRHPGAMEDCNNRDEDCDGRIDEGAALLTFHTDADRDGHGVASGPTRMACVPPAGFAASTDDCDDANPARYPGASEECNGLDDDCDAVVDGSGADAQCAGTLANVSSATCVAPSCTVDVCDPFFGNCDHIEGNGCESDSRSDAANCGGCGMPCGAATSCTGGTCESGVARVFGTGSFFSDFTGGFCAVRPSGRIACWGNAATSGSAVPVELVLPDGLVATGPHAVAFGDQAGCAAMANGTVDCWGRNGTGQFGDGTTSTPTAPVRGFPSITDARMVVGLQGATCVLRNAAGGRVVCAGANDYGMLGNGTTTPSPTPVLVGLSNVTYIDGSEYEVCAVSAGSVYCWGSNQSGSAMMAPTQIVGISDATAVTVNRGFSCALRAAGRVTCWGVTGSLLTPTTALTDVGGFSSAPVEIESSSTQFCARLTSGVVECFGANPGNGSAGPIAPPSSPVRVTGVVGGISLATIERRSSACVASASGTIRCWGEGNLGQLGDGGSTLRLTPVLVTGF